ncbi:unnamed protein product [Prorocentrum cordatum]|uniref:Protein xylosyltransferase n=1 Tax=Prorocentrum cordatum TaxID=2364126 RepID=A0ABN9RX84_9DINO|nr:unnamed protein product [Polarella glacialis]
MTPMLCHFIGFLISIRAQGLNLFDDPPAQDDATWRETTATSTTGKDGKRVAIVVAGSFIRYSLSSTLHHLIRPLVAEGHRADYYVSLTYQSSPAYHQKDWYMQHLALDPGLDGACGGKTLESDISIFLNNVTDDCTRKHAIYIKNATQKHGGRARKVVLRQRLSIDDNELVAAKRSAAVSMNPGEDPDFRFPTLDLHTDRTQVASANRNMLTLFLNYQQLWDDVVKSEDATQPYDYVMFLRDDTLWLKDFSLNRLVDHGPADLYVLSCDARWPRMWREDMNDHGSVVSRRKAELFGKYFTHLFHANITECNKKIVSMSGGTFGCNSEMILKMVVTQDGVSTKLVGQGLIPFQRSVHVQMPGGGVVPCFHKYCKSHSDGLESFGIERCKHMRA